MLFLRLASCIAVLMHPVSAFAESQPAPKITMNVVHVWSGGHWMADGLSGGYRIIVTQQGFEHISNSLFIQWISDNHPRSIVGEIDIPELSDSSMYSFGVPVCADMSCKSMSLETTHTYSNEKRLLNIHVDEPNSISVDWQ